MLCWQQNQREDFHMHLLGQAVLDEKQSIIPSLTATSESSSKAPLEAALGGPLEGERHSGHLPGRQNFVQNMSHCCSGRMSWLPLGIQVGLKLLLTFEAFHGKLGSQ